MRRWRRAWPWLKQVMWIAFAVGFVVNVVALAVATALVPGVKSGGIATVILAAVLLAAMQWGVSLAMRLAQEAGALPV